MSLLFHTITTRMFYHENMQCWTQKHEYYPLNLTLYQRLKASGHQQKVKIIHLLFKISKIVQRGLQTPDEKMNLDYSMKCFHGVICHHVVHGYLYQRVDGISVVWDCWVRLMLQYIAEVWSVVEQFNHISNWILWWLSSHNVLSLTLTPSNTHTTHSQVYLSQKYFTSTVVNVG